MEYKIILVDDHKLFRDGLKLLLNSNHGTTIVGEASNGEEFLSLLPANPDAIILMDIDMPVMDGESATRKALETYPECKIIALSMFSEYEFYVKMIEAGVRGFVVKNSGINDVLNAISTVANGESYFSKELLYHLVKNYHGVKTAAPDMELSERELDVLKLICDGLSNQEIADKLFISKRTVDKHRSNILDKTGVRNTASLVMYAIKKGLIIV